MIIDGILDEVKRLEFCFFSRFNDKYPVGVKQDLAIE